MSASVSECTVLRSRVAMSINLSAVPFPTSVANIGGVLIKLLDNERTWGAFGKSSTNFWSLCLIVWERTDWGRDSTKVLRDLSRTSVKDLLHQMDQKKKWLKISGIHGYRHIPEESWNDWAWQILVPRQPGIEPRPLALKLWCPNHWTAREFP